MNTVAGVSSLSIIMRKMNHNSLQSYDCVMAEKSTGKRISDICSRSINKSLSSQQLLEKLNNSSGLFTIDHILKKSESVNNATDVNKIRNSKV